MKQWADLNQSTLRVMCNVMKETYALPDLVAMLQKLGYQLPSFLQEDPKYQTTSVTPLLIREIVLSANPVRGLDAAGS